GGPRLDESSRIRPPTRTRSKLGQPSRPSAGSVRSSSRRWKAVRYIIDIVSRIKEARSELSRAILAPRKWPQVPRLAVRRFVRGDHPLVGRWRRRRGGRVDLAGCVFDLDVPQVSDGIFSRFVLGRYEKPEIM